jgi:hypothetical protein
MAEQLCEIGLAKSERGHVNWPVDQPHTVEFGFALVHRWAEGRKNAVTNQTDQISRLTQITAELILTSPTFHRHNWAATD